MKKKMLYISDYIEEKPVIASVRYEELMVYFQEQFDIYVLNDNAFGTQVSKFAIKNLKYLGGKSLEKISQKKRKKTKIIELLKHNLIVQVLKDLKNSQLYFRFRNRKAITKVIELIKMESIDVIFVTVPDVYPAYWIDIIKKSFLTW